MDEEATGVDEELIFRAHEIWRHSKDCLVDEPSDFDRIDCISSLRRAVNHRLKSITTAYQFDLLPSLRAKKQSLEKFQDYGIIRPALIKDLLEVRNLIEHEDAEPPEVERCKYFVDIVWYFLKSTDGLLRMRIESLSYTHDSDESSLLIRIRPQDSWAITIKGAVRETMLTEQRQPFTIELREFTSKKQRSKPGMVFFSATPVITDELLTQISREYFGVAGFWYDDHV